MPYLPIDFKVGGWVVDYRRLVPPQPLRWISPAALLRHTDCASPCSPLCAWQNRCNVGYCFINFLEPRYILPFVQNFEGQRWKSFNSEKVPSPT